MRGPKVLGPQSGHMLSVQGFGSRYEERVQGNARLFLQWQGDLFL